MDMLPGDRGPEAAAAAADAAAADSDDMYNDMLNVGVGRVPQ